MILVRFFSEFLYKSICCGYSFELHRLVDAIQMSTDNICLYKEVARKYTCCNLKTTELLDCALIGVCAVIRLNTVHQNIYVGQIGIQAVLSVGYSGHALSESQDHHLSPRCSHTVLKIPYFIEHHYHNINNSPLS